MRHQPLEEILAQAAVIETAPTLSRRARLARWAVVLKRADQRLLEPLRFVEFYAPAARARLRGEQTPITLAYADPVLRDAGLAGDSLGDAQTFFGLTDDETHFIVCDCRWHGRMTGSRAARRVRAVANPHVFNRLWMFLQRE
jgi:hypothetical protein